MLRIGPGETPHTFSDPAAHFAQAAWRDFGAGYIYGGDWSGCHLELAVSADGLPAKVEVSTGRLMTLRPEVVDAEWMLSLIGVALHPDGVIPNRPIDEIERFAAYLRGFGLGEADIRPASIFGATGGRARLTDAGRRRAWDLLRLFVWPLIGKEVVIEDEQGRVVYSCPPPPETKDERSGS
jgi:hypothetical protein